MSVFYLAGSEVEGLLASVEVELLMFEEDEVESLRVRPNNGIRVIFFLVGATLSLGGTSDVFISTSSLCGTEETFRKNFEKSEAMVRGRRLDSERREGICYFRETFGCRFFIVPGEW